MRRNLRAPKGRQLPVALSIAGSDSGGGAGIQADLRVFGALGVHGTTVITCVTAQNPKGILGIQACNSAVVSQQLAAVFAELPPRAVKTGMLYSTEIIRVVVRFLTARPDRPPLVVDPVAEATSGRRLLQTKAALALERDLLPLAALVTPNIAEAEALTDDRIRDPEEMRQAARVIHERFGCAVVVKGGHLQGIGKAVDIFYDGRKELMLTAPYIPGLALHGAGCTYSAAVTGFLALGKGLPEAVQEGKRFITRAIAECAWAGGHPVLR